MDIRVRERIFGEQLVEVIDSNGIVAKTFEVRGAPIKKVIQEAKRHASELEEAGIV